MRVFPTDNNVTAVGSAEIITSGFIFDGFALMADGTASSRRIHRTR